VAVIHAPELRLPLRALTAMPHDRRPKTLASGAKALKLRATLTAGLKPRPSVFHPLGQIHFKTSTSIVIAVEVIQALEICERGKLGRSPSIRHCRISG
jgi:hypothetical protein